ncbi:MAG: NAD(+) synthetase, partial [Halobacteria archaeon]|nr:NAD(+) synthetase [Halobacteria archaeon]
APTAGLWEGQTDEDELGASYETIDGILRRLIDEGMSAEETAEEMDVKKELVESFDKMHERSEHKRTMPEYPEFGR